MKEQQEQCQPSDIRAVISVPSFWYVDGDGKPEDFACDGDRDCSPEAEGYTCFNCGEDFATWSAALAHLQGQEVAS
jgi:hypothetical protein